MRLFGTLAVVVMFAGVATADIPPPPLEKDEKEVGVTKEVKLGKDMTGFVFVERYGARAPRGEQVYGKVKLSEEKAHRVGLDTSLFAVREVDAKAFKTDWELIAALENDKLKLIPVGIGGGYTMRVKKADIDDDSLTLTYTITGIDEKGKVTVKREGKHTELFTEDGAWRPKKKEEPKKPLAFAEPGTLIGGIAVALAVTLGGLWLVRRRK